MRLRFVAVLALFTVACAEPGDLQQEASVASGLLGSKCETIATSEMASAAVGRVDGEQSVAFGRVADAALIGDGRFIVLDGLERSMSIFDSTGHRTGQIGRRGSGPGEFEAPMGVQLTLVVQDHESAAPLTGQRFRLHPEETCCIGVNGTSGLRASWSA